MTLGVTGWDVGFGCVLLASALILFLAESMLCFSVFTEPPPPASSGVFYAIVFLNIFQA